MHGFAILCIHFLSNCQIIVDKSLVPFAVFAWQFCVDSEVTDMDDYCILVFSNFQYGRM
jgi:hypothetical protein